MDLTEHYVECSKCDGEVTLEDAVELKQKNNKQMLKVLCPDCFKKIGTPKGYELNRDLSYRAY